jgi:putative ABC transport system permease protein
LITDYFRLAFKNLKHRGIRSWLTLLGIFIGVTAVVALISLGNGLEAAVSSQFGISSTELITVEAGGISGYGPPGSNVANPLTTEDVDAIKRLNTVKRAVGRNIASGKLEYNDRVVFGYATSIPEGEDRDFIYEQIEAKPIAGRLLEDSDTGRVLLGYNFYVDRVGLGKSITPGKKVLINDESFEVVGILDKQGSFLFDNVAYLNSEDMKDLFDYGDKVDTIAVQPRNKNDIEKTKDDIEKLMRKRRNVDEGEEDFSVSTPEASLSTVNSVLGGVKIFIVLVASISIFIGALGIVDTMTTSVLERKKEIGVMKAIGAKNNQIFFQFFVESGLLGLIGGVAGIISGVLIGIAGTSALSSFLGSDLGIVIDYPLIIFSVIGSFAIGAVAGIVPAMKASKQNPVEALRG